MPKPLRTLAGSNLTQDKYFDQIAFHDPQNRLRTGKAGVFNFTPTIYGDNEASAHRQAMRRSTKSKYNAAANKAKFYKEWRTFQISDHFPLWVELKTDFANAYLATVMRGTSVASKAKQK